MLFRVEIVKTHSGFHLHVLPSANEILHSSTLDVLEGKILAVKSAIQDLEEKRFTTQVGRGDYVPDIKVDCCFDTVPKIQHHLSVMERFLDECKCYEACIKDWGKGPFIDVKEWVPRDRCKPVLVFSDLAEANRVIDTLLLQIDMGREDK